MLVICHGADEQGLDIMHNVCATLAFAKLPFAVLDLAGRASWPSLDAFAAVIVCTERLWELEPQKARMLRAHVISGGGLMVAYRCWNAGLADLFGAVDTGLEPDMHVTGGLSFVREMIPGARGLRLDDEDWVFRHSRFDISPQELHADCVVMATDLDSRPLIWNRPFGSGCVTYWNTNAAFSRPLRGFWLHSLLQCMGTGVAAAAGFAMFHVDDFPASISEERREPVTSEFPDLDWNGFFFDIWHRDMMVLREKYGLAYTWYAVMNYYDIDTGADAAMDTPAIASGRPVLERRFAKVGITAPDDEYGFHGYNHEPLIPAHWPDPATLRTKLELARTLWEETVPAPLPTSWVPANNWYRPDVLPVLKDVFPEISVVGSTFSSGDFDYGENREFGPEPWDDALLCLPRETYGYVMRPETRMMMLSQLAGMGMWTHFVHPDDIYDIPAGPEDAAYRRNPQARMWRASNAEGRPGLLPELDRWIGEIRSFYPWLEFVVTSQAAERYRAHVSAEVRVAIADDTIDLHTDTGGLFFVRTPPDTVIRPREGGELVDSRDVEGGILNVVRCGPGRTVFSRIQGQSGAARRFRTADAG